MEWYSLIEAYLREVIVNHEVMNLESLKISLQNIDSRPHETLVFDLRH